MAKINGINFNETWVKSVTEAEFVEHEKHHCGGDESKLKEVYAIITGKTLHDVVGEMHVTVSDAPPEAYVSTTTWDEGFEEPAPVKPSKKKRVSE